MWPSSQPSVRITDTANTDMKKHRNSLNIHSLCRFFYKLVIGKKEFTVAEGKSVKEAKQNAAQLACRALQTQPDWDSKVLYPFIFCSFNTVSCVLL